MVKKRLWLALAGIGLAGAFAATKVIGGADGALKTVPARLVCMMNDRVMGKPQIPVEVAGKTYFGCCPGCAKRLRADAKIRTAADPVTGRPVDKASAVIVEAADGAALYFESMKTAKRYKRTASIN
jgi:YHS domain-containing protein